MKELWTHFEQHSHANLELTECGIQQFRPGQMYHYTVFQPIVIHYVESGKGTFTVNGKHYKLCSDMGFILRRGQVVTYTADSISPWKNYWIALSGTELDTYLKYTEVGTNPTISYHPNSQCANIIKNICDYTMNQTVTSQNKIWYNMKIYEFIYYSSIEFQTEHQPLIIANRNPVDIACDYIYSNYMHQFTIAQLKEFIGISSSHLYRLFKQRFNCSPQQFILDVRMRQASQYLTETTLSIKCIASQVGYPDQLRFSKMFKSFFGHSPSEYRKLYTK